MAGGVDADLLAEELKMSCTNVMLQCFDPESRLIYVLGVMFRADSRVCGEILGITPEAYRQRLSRIRGRMSEFMKDYCGLSGSGKCSCGKRVGYAVKTHRLNPHNLEYTVLEQVKSELKMAMEEMDQQSMVFVVIEKNLDSFNLEIVCGTCNNRYCKSKYNTAIVL